MLEHEKYLVHTYTEAIIRAAFLRAATRDELVYTNVDSEKRKAEAARELIFSDEASENSLAGEVAYAIAENKLPEFRPDKEVLDRLKALGVEFVVDS